MPLSAPRALWLIYAFAMVALGVLATAGGFLAFFSVFATAAFSFQFWVFAAHRGLQRSS